MNPIQRGFESGFFGVKNEVSVFQQQTRNERHAIYSRDS